MIGFLEKIRSIRLKNMTNSLKKVDQLIKNMIYPFKKYDQFV